MTSRMIRRRRDPGDRRKQIVDISDAGEAVIAANLENSIALMQKIRDQMGSDRFEALLDLLNELERATD